MRSGNLSSVTAFFSINNSILRFPPSVIFHCILTVYFFFYHPTHTLAAMIPQYTYKRLTCRQWKLNPAGCFDGSIHCKYSHVDTGIMSPPIGTTCQSWKNNCCTLHENNCLFMHMDTGCPPSSFTFRSKGALPLFHLHHYSETEIIDPNRIQNQHSRVAMPPSPRPRRRLALMSRIRPISSI